MVLFFSKKQVTLFSMLINWQSIWCNNASYSVNKSKIAWKILIANHNFWIMNQIDRRWRIGFQGKAIRNILTVTYATVCRLDNMPPRGCCRTSSSSSWPSTCPVDCTGLELHSALSQQEIAVPVLRPNIHRYSRLYHWFLSKMLSEQPFYFPFG